MLGKKKAKEPKILTKTYTVCPHCPTDTKGNKGNCPHCGNTRKELKEWTEEVL